MIRLFTLLLLLPLFNFAQDKPESNSGTAQTGQNTVFGIQQNAPPAPGHDYVMSGTDIRHMAARSLLDILPVVSSQVSMLPNGQVFYKGLPAMVYVDGVKYIGPVNVPYHSIGEIRVINGRPAEF